MKKLYSLTGVLLAAGLLAILSSCGGDIRKSNGILMTDQGDIDIAARFVSDYIAADAMVTKIHFTPAQDVGVTKNASFMRIYYYDNGGEELKVLLCALQSMGQKPFVEKEHSNGYGGNKPENAVRFSEIDFSPIADYVARAGQMVLDADEDYDESLNFSGVGGYEMIFSGDPKNAHHKFSIESKDFETSTQKTDEYYEFTFQVVNRQLISDDDLEG